MSIRSLRSQASARAPTSAVILCHGFGAPGDDLASLGSYLTGLEGRLEDTCFIFPEGPISLGGASRAWWNIDFEALARAQSGDAEALKDFRNVEPLHMPRARALLTDIVAQTASEFRLPFSKIVLGGFSQGAMLSTDVSLRLADDLAALVVLSGTLILEPEWTKMLTQKPHLSIFQSHGHRDGVLSYAAALALKRTFEQAGLKPEFHGFKGRHEIPPEVLNELARFLSERLA
jgi:phospholipase/carboxylesterase